MMDSEEYGKDSNEFLQKFEKALQLLNSFSEKSKASFSENVSFLLDKVLDHLKKLEEEEMANMRKPTGIGGMSFHSALIRSKISKDFFSETLKISRAPTIHPPIIIFSLKLITELTSNHHRFQNMQAECAPVFQRIQELTETTVVENSEIKQTLLIMFLRLAKFKDGQEWLWSSGVLLFIISSLSDRTIFTRKTAQELIKYILPLMGGDQRKTILEHLLSPIIQAGNKLDHQQIESDRLRPFFEVLEGYMEHCLSSPLARSSIEEMGHGKIVSPEVERALLNLVQSAENEKLLSQAGSLMAAVYAYSSVVESGSALPNSYRISTLTLIQKILYRGFIRPTINVTSESLFFWSRLDGTKDFQIQLACIMMAPVMMNNEEVAEHFPCYPTLSQFWKDSALGTTRAIIELLTSMLRSNTELNEFTGLVLAGLRKSMNKFDKEFALKIMRPCMYLLGCLKTPESRRTAQLSSTPQLAIHLCKSLCAFVDIFDIRWWDSYETICMPILFTKLVAYSASRDTQMTCAGLEGLKFCIQQFIHPYQALLLDRSQDSTLNEAADVLQHCSVSIHWEVRDSAMEVILEMARLSHSRYPEFQQLLIRSHLLEAAVSALNDTESYVRASAIAVIAEATPVPLLWDHLTKQTDVIGSCYTILNNDSEALARRAATKALTLIMRSGHFPANQDRSVLYRNMNSAALFDLDWEVKLQALDFWQVLVDESLTEQGMLDGSFPEHIFSKEKQKIVRLDTEEIRSRLQKAMAQLGSCGCLHILLQLTDDCDAPVREKSIQLLRRLRDLLAAHQSLDLNFWPLNSNQNLSNPAPPTTTQTVAERNQSSQIRNSDEVIDEILSVNDVNLVAGIMTNNKELSQPRPQLDGKLPSLSARDFVTQVNVMELESMLVSTGLSSDLHVIDFDSLLDDLQDCIHTDTSRPRPDCY